MTDYPDGELILKRFLWLQCSCEIIEQAHLRAALHDRTILQVDQIPRILNRVSILLPDKMQKYRDE